MTIGFCIFSKSLGGVKTRGGIFTKVGGLVFTLFDNCVPFISLNISFEKSFILMRSTDRGNISC
jgi:hypothetical protein